MIKMGIHNVCIYKTFLSFGVYTLYFILFLIYFKFKKNYLILKVVLSIFYLTIIINIFS